MPHHTAVLFDGQVETRKPVSYVFENEDNQRNCYMALYELNALGGHYLGDDDDGSSNSNNNNNNINFLSHEEEEDAASNTGSDNMQR